MTEKIQTPQTAYADPLEALEAPAAPDVELPEPSEEAQALAVALEDPSAADEELRAEEQPGAGNELEDEELLQAVAALMFASPEPLGVGRMVALLDGPRPSRVREALAGTIRRLAKAGLPLEAREIAGGWRLMTVPAMSETVARLVRARKADSLSPASLETLAVIAYRQPVTKAEVEAIRGVQCGAMLRNLVDRRLTRVTGRADVPGHPLQYGTTKGFLDRFGLGSLKDLPRDGELLGE